jgi:acetyl-CoA C-acetyltransferase
MELGGFAIQEALRRASLVPELVDYVVMGHVLQAGQGQITARQAAVNAGIPMSVPATTINKVCLSGLNALQLADMLISTGQAEVVVAGGMESMSRAPYLIPQARQGYRIGDGTIVDSMMFDGLTCAFDHEAMGLATDRYARAAGVSREDQDALAALSHERAAASTKNGILEEEIVPVEVPQRRGSPLVVEGDEGIRPETSSETLAALRPAFDPSGTITAGNASQISDGATALVVMSRSKAEEFGVLPLGEIVSYGQVAGPDTSLLEQPSNAILRALALAGEKVSDLDLIEINEAFAAVSFASMKALGVSSEMVNVNGGAIALGHPIGASGARLALTLLYELRRRGGGLGAAALCGGGGQGDALVVRSLS